MFIQGFKRQGHPPHDIDIIVRSNNELTLLENLFKGDIVNGRNKISTGGEQIRLNINDIEIEIFYEAAKTYSEYLDKPITILIDNVKIPCILPCNELSSKKKVIKLRGKFGHDDEKLRWLEKICNGG